MELLDVVDENNDLTGIQENKDIIHEKGLLHREIAVFIQNEKGEFLIQKRYANKQQAPNKWCLTTGHVELGEEYDKAAVREVKEELAFRAQELDVDQLHVEVVRLQQPLRAHEYRLLLLAVFGLPVAVLLRGEVHEGQVRDYRLRVLHHAVAVLRRVLQQAVFGLLLGAHLADDERELFAARGLDDELFTFFYIPVVLDETEITRLTIDRQVFSHKERPP